MTNCLPAIYMMVGHSAVLTGAIAWHNIRWDIVINRVKSIQSRIVKAVKSGLWNKVKVLQRILTISYAARLLAIRRITENRGKRTPGIDGKRWNSPTSKFEAIYNLGKNGYKPLPVRRITIPKNNGKKRPLGIPTMKDRAMQALHLLALDPVSETLADNNSYGFRLHRSCADAIARCFSILAKKDAPVYILEADILGCFDNISHQWIIDNIPMDKTILRKWLKAGCFANNKFFPTTKGTPQGSIISPVLANMVLDGMEDAIDLACGIKHWGRNKPKRRINPNKIHLIRYADDFIITCDNEDLLKYKIKPAIVQFLNIRGLELSQEKTFITHIDKGFDFLSQHLRKYNGKLLIKPSVKSVSKFLRNIKKEIRIRNTSPALRVLQRLKPMIRGWAMYHRHIVAKEKFQMIDHMIWWMLWRWACRRHSSRKNTVWIKQRYFIRHEGQDWTFFALDKNGNTETLIRARNIKIQRHPKIKGSANPYDKEDEIYFEMRIAKSMLNKLEGKRRLRFLYEKQFGRCQVCNQAITSTTGWHVHHIIPKYLGGSDKWDNLVMLHPICHIQVHHKNESVAAALTKTL